MEHSVTCEFGFDEHSIISKGVRWCPTRNSQYNSTTCDVCNTNAAWAANPTCADAAIATESSRPTTEDGRKNRIEARWVNTGGLFFLGTQGQKNWDAGTCTRFLNRTKIGSNPPGLDGGPDKDFRASDGKTYPVLRQLAECVLLDMARPCRPKCTGLMEDKAKGIEAKLLHDLTWEELTDYFCIPTQWEKRKDSPGQYIEGCGIHWYKLIEEWSNAENLHTGLDIFENEIVKVLEILSDPKKIGPN